MQTRNGTGTRIIAEETQHTLSLHEIKVSGILKPADWVLLKKAQTLADQFRADMSAIATKPGKGGLAWHTGLSTEGLMQGMKTQTGFSLAELAANLKGVGDALSWVNNNPATAASIMAGAGVFLDPESVAAAETYCEKLVPCPANVRRAIEGIRADLGPDRGFQNYPQYRVLLGWAEEITGINKPKEITP